MGGSAGLSWAKTLKDFGRTGRHVYNYNYKSQAKELWNYTHVLGVRTKAHKKYIINAEPTQEARCNHP